MQRLRLRQRHRKTIPAPTLWRRSKTAPRAPPRKIRRLRLRQEASETMPAPTPWRRPTTAPRPPPRRMRRLRLTWRWRKTRRAPTPWRRRRRHRARRTEAGASEDDAGAARPTTAPRPLSRRMQRLRLMWRHRKTRPAPTPWRRSKTAPRPPPRRMQRLRLRQTASEDDAGADTMAEADDGNAPAAEEDAAASLTWR